MLWLRYLLQKLHIVILQAAVPGDSSLGLTSVLRHFLEHHCMHLMLLICLQDRFLRPQR